MSPPDQFVEAEVVVLSSQEGGRATPLLAVAYQGRYAPHIVLQPRAVREAKIELREGMRHVTDEYLAMRFWSGPDPIPISSPFMLTMRVGYPAHPAYDAIVPGAEFTIREGAKIVGHGRVTRRFTNVDA